MTGATLPLGTASGGLSILKGYGQDERERRSGPGSESLVASRCRWRGSWPGVRQSRSSDLLPAWPNADMETTDCSSELRRPLEAARLLDFDGDLVRPVDSLATWCYYMG